LKGLLGLGQDIHLIYLTNGRNMKKKRNKF